MTALFDVEGNNLNLGYINLAAARYEVERVICTALEAMWERYEPFADLDFREGFARLDLMSQDLPKIDRCATLRELERGPAIPL
jgi:hypothetical protein